MLAAYTIDAEGNKATTYYRGEFTYLKPDGGEDMLYQVHHPEGIVAKTNLGYTYNYFKTDHLGNVRVLLAAQYSAFSLPGGGRTTLEVLQVNEFYAFGLMWDYNNLHHNKYLYNGKELYDGVMSSYSGYYDFGSRMYNPFLGRWFQRDPQNQFINPYLYCANNPMMFVDPDGEFITFSFNKHGFSIGLNFGFGGFGINVGWDDGGSLGAYGEIGPRIGPVGVTMSQSFDYWFKYDSVIATTGFNAGVSFGPISFGVGFSVSTNLSTNQSVTSWGIGLSGGHGNGMFGGSLNVGYGSGGWNFGGGGYFSPGPRYFDYSDNSVELPEGDSGYVIDDVYLKRRTYNKFGLTVGDNGITDISMRPGTGDDYKMNTEGSYNRYDNKGRFLRTVKGYFDRIDGGVHISPGTAYADDVVFMAIVGHELIHAYHQYTFGYTGRWSEQVAYDFSLKVFSNAGYMYNQAYRNAYNVALKNNWLNLPVSFDWYHIPFLR